MNTSDHSDNADAARVANALKALPQLDPPRDVFDRIDVLVAAASSGAPPGRRFGRLAGFAVAASVLLAIWIAAPVLRPQPAMKAPIAKTDTALPAEAAADARIDALMTRSAYLETVLAAIPRRGRVQRVGTASTITALEDRVALIDARLSDPGVAGDADGRAVLWRQRVGLMNTLVSLHSQPTASVVL